VSRNGLTGDSARLIASSFAFGTGWLGLSFTFPLIAERLGFSYSFIGIIGLASSLPFPVVAYIYRRAGSRLMRAGVSVPLAILLAMSVALLFGYRSYFLPIAIIASFFQAPWWISSEIALGSLQGSRNAEKYSIAWGIPNATSPAIMGVIIDLYGFKYVFLIAAAAFAISMVTTPRMKYKEETASRESPRLSYIFPLFYAGIFSGFLYFVVEPLLKANGFPYYIIGGVTATYGAVVAVGFVVLNFVPDLKIWQYGAISSLLLFPALFLAFKVTLPILVAVSAISGLGVSISMSKILAYISNTSDTKTGVFYYESTFGFGFIVGSLGEDVLYQYYGIWTIIPLFLMPLAYGTYLILREFSHTSRLPGDS
jgi:MFS family permease